MHAAAISPSPLNWQLPRHWHRLLLGAGSALVLLLLASSLWQTTASQKALGELRQQGERLEHLNATLIQVMDIQSAVRSYLLFDTHNPLEPISENVTTVGQTPVIVRRNLGTNPYKEAAVVGLPELTAPKLLSLNQGLELEVGNDARTHGNSNGNGHANRLRGPLSGVKMSPMANGQTSFERSLHHLERTRQAVLGLAAGTLTLLLILFVVLEQQRRLHAQLAGMLDSKNQRIASPSHECVTQLSDLSNDLASYLTNAREAEKARLARELHDELGALLTAAKMDSDWIANRLDEPTLATCGERLGRLEAHLDRGIALKRRIINDLRPPFLEELGLICTLRTLGEDFERDGEEALDLQLPNTDIELEPETALALFRIAQEALTNIRKHAQARSVILALRTTNDCLELEIADDGVGFHADGVQRGQHGLDGIKHRVQMCDGDFHLASRPGNGTRIVVRLPGDAACLRSGKHAPTEARAKFSGLGAWAEGTGLATP